jgi:gamma-glutamylcyclotransferase (GGCT)/AIG2-like uncharacterized protein YtfP
MGSVFVYGTLQYPSIVTLLLGRTPETTKALVKGYRRYGLHSFVFPAVIEDPKGQVEGLLLSGLSEEDMAILDDYEGDEYCKHSVDVFSLDDPDTLLCTSSLYVWMDEYKHMINGKEWDVSAFETQHFDEYYNMVSGFVKQNHFEKRNVA